MTKAKTKKPAAKRKSVKRSAPAKKAAPRKAPARKKAPAVRKVAAPKKAAGFTVECRKTTTGPWEKMCSSSTKRAAFILANAYHKSHPEHWVRVRG